MKRYSFGGSSSAGSIFPTEDSSAPPCGLLSYSIEARARPFLQRVGSSEWNPLTTPYRARSAIQMRSPRFALVGMHAMLAGVAGTGITTTPPHPGSAMSAASSAKRIIPLIGHKFPCARAALARAPAAQCADRHSAVRHLAAARRARMPRRSLSSNSAQREGMTSSQRALGQPDKSLFSPWLIVA